MQRIPRLVAVSAVAALAAVAVAGCRSQPGVAAYVGSTEFTEDRVTQLVDNATAEMDGDTVTLRAPTRLEVVNTLVMQQMCEDYLRKQPGYAAQPEVTPEAVARSEGLAVGAEFTQIRAQLRTCLNGMRPTDMTGPTEAELREAYDRVLRDGAFAGTYEDFAAQIASDPNLTAVFPIARELERAAHSTDVVVNPRYRPLEFPLLRLNSGRTLVGADLDVAGVPVVPHH